MNVELPAVLLADFVFKHNGSDGVRKRIMGD